MKRELLLDAEGIDDACKEVDSFLSGTEMGVREKIAGRLSFENVLLMWREHFGDAAAVAIVMGKRLGRPYLAASVRGERFDPRGVDRSDEMYAPIARTMMEAFGFRPRYQYIGGRNIVSLTQPRKPLSALKQILVAFLCGLAVSMLGYSLLSEVVRTAVLETLVTPLSDAYLAILSGLAGPLILFTVAWGVCSIRDVTALGRNGKSLVGRNLRDNIQSTIFACLVCIPFFSLPVEGTQDGWGFFGELVQMLIDLLPTNLVEAFADGNTSQIIIIGVFVGIGTLVLGSACEGIRKGIEELNALAQFLMEQACRLLPAFIFCMVISQVWSGTFGVLLTAWVPLVLTVALIVAFFAIRIAYASVRFHIPLRRLFEALRPAMMVGLTTASSCASFGSMFSGCTDGLGVGKDQTSFGIPMNLILCQPPMIIMLVALILHCMQSYGLGADFTWYVRMALMCCLYSMVTPPVAGGMIAVIGLIFAKVGIPSSALGMATAFNVIIDYVVTSFCVGLNMLSIFETASVLGDVDRSKFEDA